MHLHYIFWCCFCLFILLLLWEVDVFCVVVFLFFSYGQILETSFEFKGVIYIVSLCCLPLLAAQYYVCLFQCMICTDSSTMRLNIKIYLYAYLILTPLSATETVLAPHSVLFVEETTITRGHPLPSVDNGQILSLVCCIGYTSTLAGNSQ